MRPSSPAEEEDSGFYVEINAVLKDVKDRDSQMLLGLSLKSHMGEGSGRM